MAATKSEFCIQGEGRRNNGRQHYGNKDNMLTDHDNLFIDHTSPHTGTSCVAFLSVCIDVTIVLGHCSGIVLKATPTNARQSWFRTSLGPAENLASALNNSSCSWLHWSPGSSDHERVIFPCNIKAPKFWTSKLYKAGKQWATDDLDWI